MFHTGVPYFGYTEQEVKEVFTALYPRLCAYIGGVTGRGDLGDDVIQEIFYSGAGPAWTAPRCRPTSFRWPTTSA